MIADLAHFLAGCSLGYIIGWLARDFKVYWDGERKARNILREYQERREREAEKEANWRYNAEREARK